MCKINLRPSRKRKERDGKNKKEKINKKKKKNIRDLRKKGKNVNEQENCDN